MGKKEKLYTKAVNSPEGLKFKELCSLAELYGFELNRIKGSHHFYKRSSIPKLIMNFQPFPTDKKMAKPFQVKQLLAAIEEHNL
ncbi:type II toxin-antitoxin system HicA family toxin [bacterium]|nr:type II toxin-antitoxin system HicA family toxin [bacterium]